MENKIFGFHLHKYSLEAIFVKIEISCFHFLPAGAQVRPLFTTGSAMLQA